MTASCRPWPAPLLLPPARSLGQLERRSTATVAAVDRLRAGADTGSGGDDVTHVTLEEAREALPALAERVVRNGEPVILSRGTKKAVALVPADLLEALEDGEDAAAARRALEDWKAEGSPSLSLDAALAAAGMSRRHAAE